MKGKGAKEGKQKHMPLHQFLPIYAHANYSKNSTDVDEQQYHYGYYTTVSKNSLLHDC